jgi:hypothetical protein
MFENEEVMQRILSIDQMISSQQKNGNPMALNLLHNLIETIKNVGMVQGTGLGDNHGRYFLIDGVSWQKACGELKQPITPNFIMWEETEFFSFLESLVRNTANISSSLAG